MLDLMGESRWLKDLVDEVPPRVVERPFQLELPPPGCELGTFAPPRGRGTRSVVDLCLTRWGGRLRLALPRSNGAGPSRGGGALVRDVEVRMMPPARAKLPLVEVAGRDNRLATQEEPRALGRWLVAVNRATSDER